MSWFMLIYSCWILRFWGSLSFGDGLVDLSRHLHGAAQLLLAITGAGLQLGVELVGSEQVVQVSVCQWRSTSTSIGWTNWFHISYTTRMPA